MSDNDSAIALGVVAFFGGCAVGGVVSALVFTSAIVLEVPTVGVFTIVVASAVVGIWSYYRSLHPTPLVELIMEHTDDSST